MTPADAGQLSDLSTATLIKTVPHLPDLSQSICQLHGLVSRSFSCSATSRILCLKSFLIVQIWQKYVDPCLCLEIVSHESHFCHIPAGVSLAAGEPRTRRPIATCRAWCSCRFWLAIGGTRTSRRCPLMRSTHRCWAWREGQQGRARRVPSKIDEMAGIVWLREQLDLSRAAVAGRA